MHRIFKSTDVIKIDEAVKIPDYIVSLPPRKEIKMLTDSNVSNLVPDNSEKIKHDFLLEKLKKDNEEYLKAEREKLLIEKAAIIKQAEIEAKQITDDAKKESERILSEAHEKSSVIFSQAHDEGYQNGINEKTEELNVYMKQLEDELQQLKMLQEEYFDTYSVELKHLALEIAEKLVCQKLDEDDTIIFPMVRRAIKSIREAKWIKVEISDKLRTIASALEESLSECKPSQSIEVELRRDAHKGTCVVHTAEGVIVASILKQIENIHEYFCKYEDKDDNNEGEVKSGEASSQYEVK